MRYFPLPDEKDSFGLRSGAHIASLLTVTMCLVSSIHAQTNSAAIPPSTAASSASKPTPGNFVDVTQASHVVFTAQASHTSKKYLIETMGSGAALFDYDNDGRLDIFLVNGAPLADPTPLGTIPQKAGPKDWNRLFHQKPDGTFEDVTEKAGL